MKLAPYLVVIVVYIFGVDASVFDISGGVISRGDFDTNFRRELFLENVEQIHLKTHGEIEAFNSISEVEIRERFCAFIDYNENHQFFVALCEICTNMVGRAMFKVLMCKLPPKQRIKIIDIGPKEAWKPLIDQDGSSYRNYEVKINLNLYDRLGIGIPERQYYCLDVDDITVKLSSSPGRTPGNYCLDVDDITVKRKSIAGSLFHRFTQCLHHIEDVGRYNAYCKATLSESWTNKEELRTITGYTETDSHKSPLIMYDPICDNCYTLYYSVINKVRYYPRLGHTGYVKGRSEIPGDDLEDLCKNPTFDLAWLRRYMIT
jgi:hypothetical protein